MLLIMAANGTPRLHPVRVVAPLYLNAYLAIRQLVRILPDHLGRHGPSYVDSGTVQRWKQPLRYAPGELLCRTAPHCAREVRQKGLTGVARQEAVRTARERILRALRTQVKIRHWGAVILPIAIYK